jgi:DNA-binding GntR family transcriptional regulator
MAVELGVSPMPVREALRQLIAERALVMFDNRRIAVPAMSPSRFAEVCLARALLEPELATLALPRMGAADIAAMVAADREIDQALARGDTETYMRQNFAFHFRLYRAAGSSVLLPLVESLWLQVGPFLRMVVGRLGTGHIAVDRHQAAVQAIRSRNEAALRESIRADILDGQEIIGRDILKPQTS